MKFLDKIFIYLYWAERTEKGRQWMILAFEKVIAIFFNTLINVFIGIIIKLLGIKSGLPAKIILSALFSFFLSIKFAEKYYTDEKQKLILKKHEKPGPIKYLILAVLILGGVFLLILSMFFLGYILK